MSKAAGFLKLAAGMAVILVMGAVESASARNRAGIESGTTTITLRVYDYVRLNRPRLLAAEGEAVAILGQASLETRWVECPTLQGETASYPDCESAWGVSDLVIRVLPKAMADSQAKGGDSLGFANEVAYLACVFYDRVNSFTQGASTTLPVLLGRACGHEIGLGTHSHSSRGIMRPFWSAHDLAMEGSLYLLFTPEQSRQMKTRLAAREDSWQSENKVAKLGRR